MQLNYIGDNYDDSLLIMQCTMWYALLNNFTLGTEPESYMPSTGTSCLSTFTIILMLYK